MSPKTVQNDDNNQNHSKFPPINFKHFFLYFDINSKYVKFQIFFFVRYIGTNYECENKCLCNLIVKALTRLVINESSISSGSLIFSFFTIKNLFYMFMYVRLFQNFFSVR